MVHVDVSNTSHYRELARRSIIVVDELHQPLFRKRDTSNGTDTTEPSTPTLDTDTGLPLPFDTSLGSNFTSTMCPDYFSHFLSDSTFLSCLPMSLLLQNSMSFFQAARSSSLLLKTLDTSCSASLAVCSPFMNKIADELISEDNCQNDYQQQNPLVMQAYAGLKAYESLYQATCLKDPTTQKYCFLEAMEAMSADDSYPYYTAVGLSLPEGSKPQCTSCLHETMKIFAGYAAQSEQPLSDTYLGCATTVNVGCGAGYANTAVQSVSKVASTSGSTRMTSGIVLVGSFLAVFSMLI